MTKIYLLTAPFDEDAKTGDGQYAASLEAGFARHYDTIPCTWLKKTHGAYAIPIPAGTTSIPEETIPSAMVLQPVANENTIISGYKLTNAHSSRVEAQDVNTKTVSPKTPKVLVGHDDKLRSLTIMDIYSQKPIELDESKVKAIISALETKKAKLTQAIDNNAATLPKTLKAKLAYLAKTYRENEDNIQSFCTLNEYVEAHIDNKRFLIRHTKALTTFEALKAHFAGPINIKELEKLTDKLTGVKDYPYDFHSKNLPYDLENDKSFRFMYDFDSLKDSVDKIIKPLEALNSIRHAVVKSHSNSFKMLHDIDAELHEKLAFIDLIYNDGYRDTYNKQEFINALSYGY